MTAFLHSVKADLLDVRLRLAVVLLALAFLAAVVYAILGGSSTSATAPLQRTPGSVTGIAVSLAPPNPLAAVAETSNGSAHQRAAAVRDPFVPLPGSPAAVAAAASAVVAKAPKTSTVAKSATSTTAPKTVSSTKSAGASTPSTPSKPSTPAKPKAPAPTYHVSVLFGPAPAGTPPQSLQLTPYENLAPNQPLPSSKQPLLVFRGVSAGGKTATFTLIGEAILHGSATCTPSPSQCQSIVLLAGQSEELEYLQPSGQGVSYQLQLVSITPAKASAATAARVPRHK